LITAGIIEEQFRLSASGRHLSAALLRDLPGAPGAEEREVLR
jgi:hypothetical protein